MENILRKTYLIQTSLLNQNSINCTDSPINSILEILKNNNYIDNYLENKTKIINAYLMQHTNFNKKKKILQSHHQKTISNLI